MLVEFVAFFAGAVIASVVAGAAGFAVIAPVVAAGAGTDAAGFVGGRCSISLSEAMGGQQKSSTQGKRSQE
ncbi:hypothetical protein ACFS07_34790 [Undibacterium arcticum]